MINNSTDDQSNITLLVHVSLWTCSAQALYRQVSFSLVSRRRSNPPTWLRLGFLPDTIDNTKTLYLRCITTFSSSLLHALTPLEVHEHAQNDRITSASNTGPLSQREIHKRYCPEDINPVSFGGEESGYQLIWDIRNGKDENLLGNMFACKRLEILNLAFAQGKPFCLRISTECGFRLIHVFT